MYTYDQKGNILMRNGNYVVAIIGLNFGMRHLEGAISNGYEIGALCDLRESRLKEFSEKYNIPMDRCFTDYHELLKMEDLDIVVIATPDQLHRPLSEEFLAAGKHVLCEKPLALTREDINAIVATEHKSGARFMVGQICRFTPAFVKAKEIIDAGTIGELYFVESEYAHDYMRIMADVQAWRSDPLRHGVIGGGCHAVDLLRWIAGNPTEVFAYGTHKLLPMAAYDDATVALLKFPNNVMGKVFVSTGCKRDYTMRTVIYGTKGTIICDNTSDHLTLFTVDETEWTKPKEIIPVEVNNHNAAAEISVFVDAIKSGEKVMTDAAEGASTVATCLAIVESAKKGVAVAPDYKFD